jgi:hypothetical protein
VYEFYLSSPITGFLVAGYIGTTLYILDFLQSRNTLLNKHTNCYNVEYPPFISKYGIGAFGITYLKMIVKFLSAAVFRDVKVANV